MRLQPYTKDLRQLRNKESERNRVPQGRTHQPAIHYKAVSPEDIPRSDIWGLTWQVVRIYVYTHKTTINRKRGLEFEGKKDNQVWA